VLLQVGSFIAASVSH